MCRSAPENVLLALLLVPAALPVGAHNGAVAVAVPVEGIVVDGDLSDWPEGMHVYPIRENTGAYGKTDLTGANLDSSADCSPEFVVGYSLQEQLLYVGVRVRDDQVEVNMAAPYRTDACEVYVAARHGAKPFQHVLSPEGGSYWPGGRNPSLSQAELGLDLPIGETRIRGVVGRVDDVTVYEWALELLGGSLEDPLPLEPEMAIGFEVVAVDKDANGDPSAWVSWTPQGHGIKYQDPLSSGDLVLVGPDLTLEGMLDLLQDGRSDIYTGSRSMRLSNCGCPYPLHYRASAGKIAEIQIRAYPLGVLPDTEYSAKEVTLSAGDYIVLHSDGFSEATNANEEVLGFDGTLEAIRQGCSEGLSPEELIDRLIDEVKAFAGDEPQADDMTCVVVKVEA